MNDFLTITEAIAFTKKSKSTIRRFVNSVVTDSNSAHRDAIRPTPAEVEQCRETKQPFQWTISRTLLEQEFLSESQVNEQLQSGVSAAAADASRLFAILEHELVAKEKHLAEVMQQLNVKDDQIARLNNTVDSLQERLREGNLLIGTLQQRLSLTPPHQSVTDAIVTPAPPQADRRPPKPAAKLAAKATAAAQRSKTTQKKRRWLFW